MKKKMLVSNLLLKDKTNFQVSSRQESAEKCPISTTYMPKVFHAHTKPKCVFRAMHFTKLCKCKVVDRLQILTGNNIDFGQVFTAEKRKLISTVHIESLIWWNFEQHFATICNK